MSDLDSESGSEAVEPDANQQGENNQQEEEGANKFVLQIVVTEEQRQVKICLPVMTGSMKDVETERNMGILMMLKMALDIVGLPQG